MMIIDAHVHCGVSTQSGAKIYSEKEMQEDLEKGGAQGAVIMAFPEDIYRLNNSKEERNKANEYILDISSEKDRIYPFYFVWNDFIIPDNLSLYRGVKWHRHAGEPSYNYDDSKCFEFLREVKKYKLPVIIEEEFQNTVEFIKRNPELNVIIPHIGEDNGGPKKMKVFFDNPNVFFDTAITDNDIVQWAYDTIGPERLIFGTDASGCRPRIDNSIPTALKRLSELNISDRDRELIYGRNIENLIAKKI